MPPFPRPWSRPGPADARGTRHGAARAGSCSGSTLAPTPARPECRVVTKRGLVTQPAADGHAGQVGGAFGPVLPRAIAGNHDGHLAEPGASPGLRGTPGSRTQGARGA